MNLRTHKRRACAGLRRRFDVPGRRLMPSAQVFVGWVRCTRLDGGIRWMHLYTAVAR